MPKVLAEPVRKASAVPASPESVELAPQVLAARAHRVSVELASPESAAPVLLAWAVPAQVDL